MKDSVGDFFKVKQLGHPMSYYDSGYKGSKTEPKPHPVRMNCYAQQQAVEGACVEWPTQVFHQYFKGWSGKNIKQLTEGIKSAFKDELDAKR
jgi:hypothetical protein